MFLNSNNSSLASQCQMPQGTMELFFQPSIGALNCLYCFSASFHIPILPILPIVPRFSTQVSPIFSTLVTCLERCVQSVQPSSAKLAFGTTAPNIDLAGFKTCHVWRVWNHLTTYLDLIWLDIRLHSIRSKFGLTDIYIYIGLPPKSWNQHPRWISIDKIIRCFHAWNHQPCYLLY